MAQDVFFLPTTANAGEDQSLDLHDGLLKLGQALQVANSTAKTWALKVHLGAKNRPAAVDPAWVRAAATMLNGPAATAPKPGAFAFDTLSITTQGLDQPETQLFMAQSKGFGATANGIPYVVADGPEQGAAIEAVVPADSLLSGHTLAGGLAAADGLCVLTPVRPHPHVGFRGAVTTMGVGLADRAGKILLHQDIRPQVNTPLCAGCGVCMTVCLFDAIQFSGGRAFIDHTLCTGCGECMNVCFMAGISAEEAAGIPLFQAKVADSAWAARNELTAGQVNRQVYLNFLVRLDRQLGGARTRNRERLGDVGVLASRDPVALDQATYDMISARMGGKLVEWSGFNQLPDVLLARAEAIGLGKTAYNLVTL